MSTARDPGFKDHISCWLKGGLQLRQRPNVVASWITPSKATCCLCWCTLRAEYLLRLSFFRAALGSQQNWSTEISRRAPCPHTYTASPIIPVPHLSATFVIKDEPTLTHHYGPESRVYIRVHAWCCTFCGFGLMYNDMYPLSSYCTE